MARNRKTSATPAPGTPPSGSPDAGAPDTGLPAAGDEVQSGSITGFVLDEAGEPLPGAHLTLLPAGNLPASAAATDLDGEYLLLSVAPGPVTLGVSHEGYTPQGCALEVHAGTRHQRSFTLAAAPPAVRGPRQAEDGPRQPEELVRVLAQAVRSYFGIPASVTIAMYALESGWGEHLAAENNPFGIKAVGTEPAAENGYARFRIMPHAFQRFGQILATRAPYREHTERLKRSKAPIEKRVREYVRAIAPSWAEDPKYAEKVLGIIDASDLHRYDR